MNNLICYGTNIKQSQTDVLMEMKLDDVASLIRNNDEIAYDCKRLRNVRRLDVQAYNKAKTCLPYIAVASFNNGIRHSNNFLHSNYLIIDLDHCAESIEKCNEIKHQLVQANNQIMMAFVSPSGTGLKLLFKMATPITDSSLYTRFYRHFVNEFCKSHQLEKFADYKNCDVTRVCFLANDKQVYYNPQALPLYVEINGTTTQESDGPIQTEITAEENSSNDKTAISNEVYKQILQTLNPGKAPTRRPKNIFVPDILNRIEPIIKDAIEPYNFSIEQKTPIQYGLQFCITHGINKAVINIFYGKKGFSVVAIPRSDTHAELNTIVHKLVADQLFEIENAVSEIILKSINT